MRAKEIGRNKRGDHSGNEQTHQDRNHDRETERLEELTRNPGHERYGQEHGNDRHGRCKHCKSNLVSSVQGGLIGRLSHPHMPNDIFDFDDRIVDKNARDEAQREHRKSVQSDPHEVHEKERGDGRKRYCEREIAVARISRRNKSTTRTARIAPSIKPSIADRYWVLV